MATQTWLSAFLVLHLTGLVLMAGTTIIDYLTYRLFWKIYAIEKRTSTGLIQLMSRYSRILGIGAALLILTGIGMMALTRGVFGEQLWFRIKFVLVLLLVANGLLNGRRLGMKQRKILSTAGFVPDDTTGRIKSRLNSFYLSQLGIFITIVFLSVFKFS